MTTHATSIALALLTTALAGGLAPAAGTAQSVTAARYGPPLPLDRAAEVALARSAAPPAVSAAASVLVLEGGEYVLAEEGTSGATCYVSRSLPGSIEPHCFDAEGSRTILPIHVHRAERGFAGAAPEEIEREVADGITGGRFRPPARPVVSYMLSGSQVLYADDGRRVNAWRPHVMIYQPYWTAEDVGLTGDPGPGPVFLSDPGTFDAVLVVVVPEFVEPDLPDATLQAIATASLAAHEGAGGE